MIFVDTNIFVYQLDETEPQKQATARALLEQIWTRRTGRVSVQVMRELYTILTRKLSSPLSAEEARRIVLALRAWKPVPENVRLFESGLEIEKRWQLSLWDSLIVAAARVSGASILLTEDLQHGMKFDEMRVVNPFLNGSGSDAIHDLQVTR